MNDDSLENVLSVCDTKKLGYRIRYDSEWKDDEGRGFWLVSKEGMTATIHGLAKSMLCITVSYPPTFGLPAHFSG